MSSIPPTTEMSWEGDRMFNIYIYDYCHKRGFKKTARELQLEAELAPGSEPPINARQGLLFEWWSVFWVLFSAKANPGTGSDEAMLYTQHQSQQALTRRQPPQPPSQSIPPTQQMSRPPPMNGMPPQQGRPYPNGSQPPPPQQQGGPSGNPPPFNMAPNGAPPQGQNPNFRPPPQQRPGPPFQSPTMAPQRPTGTMLPPGQQGVPGYPQMRPPSRTQTPGRGNMMPQQPSMMPPTAQQVIEHDFSQIPAHIVHPLKAELGLEAKEVGMLTPEDKQRIISQYRTRVSQPQQQRGGPPIPNQKPGGPGPNPMMTPNPNQRNSIGGPLPMTGPPGAPGGPPGPRPGKRNSTSPEEQPDQARTESSPPDRKRPRRSPMGDPSGQQQPGQPHMQLSGQPMYPPQMGGNPGQGSMGGPGPNPIMRGPGPFMNGGPGPGQAAPGGGPGFQQQMIPNMGGMPGGPGGVGGSPSMGALQGQGMMAPHMQSMGNMPNRQPDPQSHYRQSLHAIHRQNMPQPGQPTHSPNAGGGAEQQQQGGFNGLPPPGGPPQFNPPRGPQPGGPQQKMMPPPSPGMKDPSKDGKPDASPQQANTAPPTPAPNSQQGGPVMNSSGPGNIAPSPQGMMNSSTQPPPQSASAPPALGDAGLFSNDFIQSVANSLDDFGPELNGDINFERDFGQWFNHPDDVTGLDFK